MSSSQVLLCVVALGVGATAVLDGWVWLLHRMGVPNTGLALVGRWFGHLARGRMAHASISKASPVAGEAALGWVVHYAVGAAFSGALLGLVGVAWLREPTLLPALSFGLVTVLLPWLVMQPAMGAGLAASRAPNPWSQRARSLANHAVFGIGLYLSAWCLRWVLH